MDPRRLREASPFVFELPPDEGRGMRAARVFADAVLLAQIARTGAWRSSRTWPRCPALRRRHRHADMHEGYGFPVGGVAATVVPDGSSRRADRVRHKLRRPPHGLQLRRGDIERCAGARAEMSRSIPSGVGRGGRNSLGEDELDEVLRHGCEY